MGVKEENLDGCNSIINKIYLKIDIDNSVVIARGKGPTSA